MDIDKYNVLVLGSGGREHTLGWKIAQSKRFKSLFTAPGNAGTAEIGTNLSISEMDFPAVKKAVIDHHIHLVVVGPEAPLVKGIVDYFASDEELSGRKIIGPTAAGAMLEGSKDFAKEFMQRHHIPTASYRTFTTGQFFEATDYFSKLEPPYVLKADGLAAGKGVIITNSLEEATRELNLMLNENKFGPSGRKVVIESFLKGIELSVFVMSDGNHYLILPEAKDYKRIGENDTGPNTGGMGSLSPVPFANEEFMRKVENKIIKPTVQGLLSENIPYKGFIFFGLIKVGDEPFVIEYNARLGDPETEVVLPRINNDFLELLLAISNGTLDKQHIDISDQSACCVMMVAPGYPGNYPKGMKINGLKNVNEVIPFHAGTIQDKNSGEIVTNGGRVLGVTALADGLKASLEKAYEACSLIHFEGNYYRHDLGNDLLQ
jgi:phosphoribosylamine--glycine ligase